MAAVLSNTGGNLGAVTKAILLDPEARNPALPNTRRQRQGKRDPSPATPRCSVPPEPVRNSCSPIYPPMAIRRRERAKFPADARIARFSRTTAELVQMPVGAERVRLD